MRKILLQHALKPDTFEPTLSIVVKNEDGTKIVYKKTLTVESDPLSKYTEAQRTIINNINAMLKENDQPLMTTEEMDWAADPYGQIAISTQTTEEDLQALSGFRVEKKLMKFPVKE